MSLVFYLNMKVELCVRYQKLTLVPDALCTEREPLVSPHYVLISTALMPFHASSFSLLLRSLNEYVHMYIWFLR
jgi:hypothetical protein